MGNTWIKRIKYFGIIIGVLVVFLIVKGLSNKLLDNSYQSEDLVLEKELEGVEEYTVQGLETYDSHVTTDEFGNESVYNISSNEEPTTSYSENSSISNLVTSLREEDLPSYFSSILSESEYYSQNTITDDYTRLEVKYYSDNYSVEELEKYSAVSFITCLEAVDIIDGVYVVFIYKSNDSYSNIAIVCDYSGVSLDNNYYKEQLITVGNLYTCPITFNNTIKIEKEGYTIYLVKG